MTSNRQVKWDDLLCEVARKVGWIHWQRIYLPSDEPIRDIPKKDGEPLSRIMRPGCLDDIAALSEKAGVVSLSIRHFATEFAVSLKLVWSDPDWEPSRADTITHALLLALARAVGIEVEKFEEAAP